LFPQTLRFNCGEALTFQAVALEALTFQPLVFCKRCSRYALCLLFAQALGLDSGEAVAF
jgi:hypothetical protein